MNYLYHVLPEKIHGSALIPLNDQKETHLQLYKQNLKKYSGRKSVTKTEIPFLKCTWSDVIHLTPVHPTKFKAALKKAGLKPKNNVRWIKINPHNLDQNSTVLYKYTSNSVSRDQFLNLRPNLLNQYNQISDKALKYYKECIKKDVQPLLFHFVPHVLYKGKIAIKNTQTISWD